MIVLITKNNFLCYSFYFCKNYIMVLLVILFILVLAFYFSINFEYDIISNLGKFSLNIFGIRVVYFTINITKQFLVIATSKKIYQVSLKINEEDLIFINSFFNKFKNHSYGTKLNIDCNIGYRDSFDIVRIYSLLDIFVYHLSNSVYSIYNDIEINKNIFYSFTNTNCKIRIKFCVLVNLLDLIYILIYSFLKRITYVKKY